MTSWAGSTAFRVITFAFYWTTPVQGVMILNITAWWNDLRLPLVLFGDQDKITLTVAVASISSRFSMDFPLVLTGLFLASVPPVLTCIVLQHFIRRGLVAGALK